MITADSPQQVVMLVVLAAAIVLTLAWLLRRHPSLLPLFAVAAIPFRIPIAIVDISANLLLPLYFVITAGCLNFVLISLRQPRSKRPFKCGWVELALLIFVLSYLVQSLYSLSFSHAVGQLVFFYIPFGLLYRLLVEVRWSERSLRQSALATVLLALVFTGIGFWEFETRHLFWNSKVIDANQFAGYFRVNSVFFDPNIFGRYLVVAILILVAALLWQLRTRLNPILALATFVLWAGMVTTLSQSSFAGLLAGLTVLAALRWSVRWTGVATSLLATVAVLVVLVFHDTLHLNLDGLKSVNVATSGRARLISGGADLFAERPIFGYGSGSFSSAFQRHKRDNSKSTVTASHNTAVTVAAEQGILGLAGYLFLIAVSLLTVFAPLRGPPAGDNFLVATRAFLAASFVAIFVHTMLYSAFLEDPIVWVLLAVAVAIRRPDPQSRRAT